MSDELDFFKKVYEGENQLRALGEEAERIEKKTGIHVIRCNVGQPTGPEYHPSTEMMAEYYGDNVQNRDEKHNKEGQQVGKGYAPHPGPVDLREVVAREIEQIDRLPANTLNASNVYSVPGGTGGLNIALSIFENGANVLVSDPYYPPWNPITYRNNHNLVMFPLKESEDYLLNEQTLRDSIENSIRRDPQKPVVLMYHYPHNPSGKTLSAKEAKDMGEMLSRLAKDYPPLHLIQEDIYIGTIRSDLGVHTPLQHMTKEAREKTILVHSPSKEGHPQDRGTPVVAFGDRMKKLINGSTAFANLGGATVSLVGTARTLADIARFGIEPKAYYEKKYGEEFRTQYEAGKIGHRFRTADYYQNLMKIVGQGFLDLEAATGQSILYKDSPSEKGIAKGAYYPYPKLAFLKGMKVPEALQMVDGKKVGPETIETSYDIMRVLRNADKIGLVPVQVAPGSIFARDDGELRLRLAAVDKEPQLLAQAANTIKGVVAKIILQNPEKGIPCDLEKLGPIQVHDPECLPKNFPPKSTSIGAFLPYEQDGGSAVAKFAVKANWTARSNMEPGEEPGVIVRR